MSRSNREEKYLENCFRMPFDVCSIEWLNITWFVENCVYKDITMRVD